MSPRPTVADVTELVYESVEAFASLDEAQDWHLLKYLDALFANVLGTIHTYVRDRDDYPGWTVALDPDNAPVEGLPWLSQFAGVRLAADMSEAEQRDAIRSPAGFQRGTLASMIAAAQRTLTGSKQVLITERYQDNAWKLYVSTVTEETPDTATTEAAIASQKPVGIVLTYANTAQQSWDDLIFAHSDWNTVVVSYDDWAEVLSTPPAP